MVSLVGTHCVPRTGTYTGVGICYVGLLRVCREGQYMSAYVQSNVSMNGARWFRLLPNKVQMLKRVSITGWHIDGFPPPDSPMGLFVYDLYAICTKGDTNSETLELNGSPDRLGLDKVWAKVWARDRYRLDTG